MKVVAAFSFGDASCFANILIQARAKSVARENGCAIFFDSQLRFVADGSTELIPVSPEKLYEPTAYVALCLKAEAERSRWKDVEVIVVAAPQHAWRCLRDIRKAGFSASADLNLKATSAKHFYDGSSSYWWVRGPVSWWLRELPLRALSFASWPLYVRATV